MIDDGTAEGKGWSEAFLYKLSICQGKASFHPFVKKAFISAQLCKLDQKRYMVIGNVSDWWLYPLHLSVVLMLDSRLTDIRYQIRCCKAYFYHLTVKWKRQAATVSKFPQFLSPTDPDFIMSVFMLLRKSLASFLPNISVKTDTKRSDIMALA